MRIFLQILAVIGVVGAQAYVLYQQLESDVLLSAWGLIAILKWQALGQLVGLYIAPDGFRFVAMALSSFVAAFIALALAPVWITGILPVIALIALFSGEPLMAVVIVGLTFYVAASYFAFLLLKEWEV